MVRKFGHNAALVSGAVAAVVASVLVVGCSGEVAPVDSEFATASDAGHVVSSKPDAGKSAPAQQDQKGAACPSTQTQCNGVCVTTTRDGENCGGCGVQCGAGEACSDSVCTTTCGGSESLCQGDADGGAPYCAPLASDNENCGACGVKCGDGEACSQGVCAPTCGPTQRLCGVADPDAGVVDSGEAPYCASLASDQWNCGACGVQCSDAQVCDQGECVTECASGSLKCDGKCVDPQSDPDFCGATDACSDKDGTDGVACDKGQACVKGKCAALGPQLVGSYVTHDGPDYSSQEASPYSCVAACAAVFGGSASSYSCSTVADSVNHLAWASSFGGDEHCAGNTPIAEDYTTGKYDDLGDVSAYTSDWCNGQGAGNLSTNYCFSK